MCVYLKESVLYPFRA